MTGTASDSRREDALRDALAPSDLGAADEGVHAQLARLLEVYGGAAIDADVQKSESTIAEKDPLLSDLAETIHPVTSAEACLVPALAAIGWAGIARDVKETLPYFDRIRDVEGLRSALARLNYKTERTAVNLAKIPLEMIPCLFSADGVNVRLVIDRGPSGELLLFDGVTGEWRVLNTLDMEGIAYPIIAERTSLPRAKSGPWLSRVIRQFKPLILKIFLLTFIVNLSSLSLPLFVMHLYDLGIGARAFDVVLYLVVGASIVIAADQILRRLRARALAYFGARLDALIAMTSFQQLMLMPLAMTESAPVSAQISRLKGFESIRDIFTGTLATAVIDIPFIVIMLAGIAFIGGHLVWIPMCLIAVYAVVLVITIPLTRSWVNRTGEAKAQLQNLLVELVGKRNAIREVSAERIWVARHYEIVSSFSRQDYSAQLADGFIRGLAQSLVTIAGVCTLGFGALSIMSGTISTGALIGVMALVWRVLSPLQTTFLAITRLQQATQTLQHVNRLMELSVERDPDERLSFYRKFKGGISLNRLVFRYSGSAEPVLRGIQFQIMPGEVIALTGKSGSGKSTVLKLVAGLYPATAGAVLADGLDIRQVDPAEWRSAIGYAPQTAAFFHGTVSQNLRLACPEATDEQVLRAAAEMGLEFYAELFPNGLETRLSAAALRQLPDALKQRLLLARCFVKHASLYLLDSPEVNLDTAGEAALMRKIANLRGASTVIFTTYRPSHMRLADRVVVFENGQIAMHGPGPKVAEKLASAA
jgi:ATP-binding cassette subfamily C protein LapB